jgi:hypothetical protein
MNTHKVFMLFVLLIYLSKQDAFDFIPVHKATIQPIQHKTAEWTSPCFMNNTAKLKSFDKQGASIQIIASNATSILCYDLYIIITTQTISVKPIYMHGSYEFMIDSWNDGEYQDVINNGFQIFLVQEQIIGTLIDIWNTYQLFKTLDKTTEAANLKFIKENMNITLEYRPYHDDILILDESMIKSGDYFAITRLQGADTMIMYGTGGMTGHTALALWFGDELYIIESSGNKTYWPEPYGIIRTAYRKWMQQAIKAEYLIDFLPLSKNSREKFNVNAAIQYFKTIEGLPYGYHNFFYSYIDTPKNNYQKGITAELVALIFSLLDRIEPDLTHNVWNAALNMRLGLPSDTRFHNILQYINTKNLSFAEVVAWPEQDEWIYMNGKSLVCSSFVISIYKAGGLFGNMTIQATEFTPKDTYQLNFFDDQMIGLPEKCKRDGMPYCQLMGRYKLPLPGFNSISPYDHMNEKCPSMPPDYKRPPKC